MKKTHSPTQNKGFEAEQIACQFLQKNGLRCVTRNFWTPFGEIDLIMEDNQTRIFVEVRFRKFHYTSAIESIDKAKQKKLTRTASAYLQRFPTWKFTRLDIVAIGQTDKEYQIRWIKDAFQVQ